MSECGKKQSRKPKLVPRTLNKPVKLSKQSKVKKRKPLKHTSVSSGVKQENDNIVQNAIQPCHVEVAICDDDREYPKELEPQHEVRMKIPKMTVKIKSVCASVDPTKQNMENEDSVMPFTPIREDRNKAVSGTDPIDSVLLSEIDVSVGTAHIYTRTETQDNTSAIEKCAIDTMEVNDHIIDATENDSNEEISPADISIVEISPEEISTEVIYLDEINLETNYPQEISPEDMSPEEISPKEMSSEKKYCVEESQAEISLKEIIPEKNIPKLSLSFWDAVKLYKDNTDLQMVRLMLKVTCDKILNTKIVSYKCYACRVAWQHYSEFREHMKYHFGKLKIGLEFIAPIKKHIIAYKHEKYLSEEWSRQHIPVFDNGAEILKCLLCNRVFVLRNDLFQHSSRKFLCVCGKLGYCDVMVSHKDTCPKSQLHYYPKKCKCRRVLLNQDMTLIHDESCAHTISYRCLVCKFYASSAEALLIHQRDEHAVRSDEITTVSLRKCRECDQIHPEPSEAHYCPRKADTYLCKFCGNLFQSTLFLDVHSNAFGYRQKCSVDTCNAVLEAGCLQPMHNIEEHGAPRLAVNASTATGQFKARHFRSNHTRRRKFRSQPQLRRVIPKDRIFVEKGKTQLSNNKQVPGLRTYRINKGRLKTVTNNCNKDNTTSEQRENTHKVSYPSPGSSDTVVPETGTLDLLQEIQVPASNSFGETSSTDSETEFQGNTDIVVEEYVANATVKVKEESLDITEHDINIPEDNYASYNEIHKSLTESKETYVSNKHTVRDAAIKIPNVTEAEIKPKKVKRMAAAEIKIPKLNKVTKAATKSFKLRVSENLARHKQQDVINAELEEEPISDEDELALFREFVNEDEDISSIPSTGQEPIGIEEFIKNNPEITLDTYMIYTHVYNTSTRL